MKPAATAVLVLGLAVHAVAEDGEWTERDLAIVRSLALSELPAPPPAPSNRVAYDPAAAALGRQIFFDARFSGDGSVSCATCHDPAQGFQDGRPLGVGLGVASRRTIPLVGAAYSPFLFWDGRADSLWSQALGPLEAAAEHGGDRTQYAHLVAANYRHLYEPVFGPLPPILHLPPRAGPVADPVARAAWSEMAPDDRTAVTGVFVNIGKAIAAFERTLAPAPTRFDVWVESESLPKPGVLNATEIAGLRLFIGRAGCINCHNGPLFTNQTFHNTGVSSGPGTDVGRAKGARIVVLSRFNCRGPYSDAGYRECPELRFLSNRRHDTEGAFKTPGLRGVTLRPPYMHTGQLADIEEVLDHYSRAEPAVIGHSELAPLNLTSDEKHSIKLFLRTLVR